MATVKMKRGSHYADIFDSPETIGQAEKDGYELVTEEKKSEPKESDAEKNDGGKARLKK
jgi:hypothetical protein